MKSDIENKERGIDLALRSVGGPEFGRISRLAEKIGVSRQVVSHWIKTGEIPPTRIREVSKATGIPAHLLNDLFSL